jgi:hypothetical protein
MSHDSSPLLVSESHDGWTERQAPFSGSGDEIAVAWHLIFSSMVRARRLVDINWCPKPDARLQRWHRMSSTPTLSEWIETATTTLAVRPEYRENLKEEFGDWLEKAASVQVSSACLPFSLLGPADGWGLGPASGCYASRDGD